MIAQVLDLLKDRIATDEKLTPEKKAELQKLVNELAHGLGALPTQEKEAIKNELEAKKAGDALETLTANLMPKLEAFGGLAGLQKLAGEAEVEEEVKLPGNSMEAQADEAPVAAVVRQINDTLLRFETAHPTLTATTNRLADMLASVGI